MSTSDAAGGAIFSSGNVQCTYGMIRNSYATSYGGGGNGRGGGIYTVSGGVTLQGCSMDSNQAITGGAIYQSGPVGVTLINSTISGNRAGGYGGVFSNGVATLKNSTIAFNDADAICGGLYSKASIVAQSTIISNNSSGHDPSCVDLSNPVGRRVTGANNLFGVAPSGLFYPQDTIIADPKLTRLGLRGGWSLVHGLGLGSPALDMGNNNAALVTDQRGSARQYGTAPDIGAYERDPADDEIFYGSFR
jgi:hypothetical protein